MTNELSQEEQAHLLTTPVDFHTADDEEEKLQEEFGDPNEEGIYGAPGR